MPRDVIMPALGMAQSEGVLLAWLKSPGDAVKAGEAIMEVETDKATMEVEADTDGFLTDLRAEAGQAVPVGQVVAVISETADAPAAKPAAEPKETKAETPSAPVDALPEGRQVIMPALGMAQDTGLIVAWHKAAGDAVSADDVLLEVETDKATMEVPAGFDGFIAATLAEAGEDVPVGESIAVISAKAPEKPVARSRAAGAPAPAPAAPAAETESAPETAKGPAAPAAAPAPAQKPAAGKSVAPGERILASPKARRMAAEQGLDLSRLVEAGYSPPFHVADLETLRGLPAPQADAAGAPAGAMAQRLTAEVPGAALTSFMGWLAKAAGAPVARASVLAAFAAAALRDGDTDGDTDGAIGVAVSTLMPGKDRHFNDPDLTPLDAVTAEAEPDAATPALILRDLAGGPLSSVQLGAEAAPVLTLTGKGETLCITYEGTLTPERALALVTGFAGRLADPMRHLL